MRSENKCGTAGPVNGPCTCMSREIALPFKVCNKLLETVPVLKEPERDKEVVEKPRSAEG